MWLSWAVRPGSGGAHAVPVAQTRGQREHPGRGVCVSSSWPWASLRRCPGGGSCWPRCEEAGSCLGFLCRCPDNSFSGWESPYPQTGPGEPGCSRNGYSLQAG